MMWENLLLVERILLYFMSEIRAADFFGEEDDAAGGGLGFGRSVWLWQALQYLPVIFSSDFSCRISL